MLTISKPLSAGQAQAYHKEEFANAQENYYSEGERYAASGTANSPSEWGLSGEVQEEHFRASRRPASDHGRATGAAPDAARIRERARRDGAHDGAPRGMGCDVLRTEERIADRAGGRRRASARGASRERAGGAR